MGNSCSDSYRSKFTPVVPEMHIQDFRRTYKSSKFPKTLSFPADSSLFQLKERTTGELYILKKLYFRKEKELALFINSLDSIILMEHDKLLKIYHYAVQKNRIDDQNTSFTLCIVLEYFDHTLQDELVWRSRIEKTFTETEIRGFLIGLVDALEFLQLKNIHIGSLKPSNIFITPNKEAKLMFLGDLPSSSNNENSSQNPTPLTYMSPQMRSQFGESVFPEKMNALTIPSAESTQSICSPFKSTVFSLGLIVLEMISMKSVSGLNETDSNAMRKYRIIECAKNYGSSLLNIIEMMLLDNEQNRPDFLDLKNLIIMEEWMESNKGARRNEETNIKKDFKGLIEMKTMRNLSEFKVPAKLFIESSEDTDLSLIMGMSQEGAEKLDDSNNFLKWQDLTPTKPSINHVAEEKGEKKETNNNEELFLEGLEEEKKDSNKDFGKLLIDNEKDLHDFCAQKTNKILKLMIDFEEKNVTTDAVKALGEFIGWQRDLKELVISLPKTKLGDEGIDLIAEGIKRVSETCLCYFDFRKAKISDEGIRSFGKCLVGKQKLVQLGLNVSDNKITKDGCLEIANWFEELKPVRSLALNIGGNKVTNEGLVNIGSKVNKLRELESIMIYLHTSEIEGKEGIIALFDGLKEIKELKRVKLDFSSNLLGDEEMELIVKYLKEINVEEISIDLKDNCISEEVRVKIKREFEERENINIKF